MSEWFLEAVREGINFEEILKRPELTFKKLLILLAVLSNGGENEFESREVSEWMSMLIMFQIEDETLQKRWLVRVRPKLISNDLRRLYMMGFLRRRKVPRTCTDKKGRKRKCGYKYRYMLNNQAIKYLSYLMTEGGDSFTLTSSDIEDVRLATLKWKAWKKASEEEKPEEGIVIMNNLVKKEINEQFSGKGYRRFIRNRMLREREINCLAGFGNLIREYYQLKEELEAKELRLKYLEERLKECEESKERMFKILMKSRH